MNGGFGQTCGNREKKTKCKQRLSRALKTQWYDKYQIWVESKIQVF